MWHGVFEDTQFLECIDNPVIERAIVLKLESANRVRNIFYRIRNAVREVIKRIDAPFTAGAMVIYMPNTVDHRVAHHDVGVSHINL